MFFLSTRLRYGYFFCAAVPYLLFPPCCAMSTFSTLLRHILSFHAAVLHVCLLFPRGCCAMTPFSMIDSWELRVNKNPFLANYYCVRCASQFPMIGPALFISIIYQSSEQTVKPWSDAELSSVWSESALFGYVLEYDAIGYVRSYRDGDRILQNSLVLIIFCYSFNDRFILSYLGNHNSLTFQFGSLFSYHY